VESEVKLNATESVNNKEYKLCAMVNHSGGIGGGHYTARVPKKERGVDHGERQLHHPIPNPIYDLCHRARTRELNY